MDQKIKIILLVALAFALANAGVLPAPRVLEGPSSKTTIVGPDGSKISAFAPGGKIVLDENPGPVLQAAPVVIAVEGVPQPLPVVQTQVIEEVTPVVETQVIEEVTPVVETQVIEEVTPVVSEIKSDIEAVSVEAVPVPVENLEGGEASELARSSVTENSSQIEATTISAPTSTSPLSSEANTEPLELVENSTASTSENVTDIPLQVARLVKEVNSINVRAAETVEIIPPATKTVMPQPVVAYIQDSPLYVPENLFEEEILGR